MVVENSPSYHTTSNDVENFPNDVDNLSALEIIQVLRNLLQEKYISAARRTFGEKLLHVLESSLPEKPNTENIQSSASMADIHPETYAKKVKKGPHTVLLYPAQNTDEQGAERNKAFSVKHLLESSIHPLKDKIKIKDPKGKLRKVIFYYLPNDIKEPELAEVIRLRSGVADETIKVEIKLKGRRECTSHWVVETSPSTFHLLTKNKKILLNWTAYSVREFIGVRRCFKCQNFGHTQKIATTTFSSALSVQEDMTLGIALAIIFNASTALSQTITKRPIMILGIQQQMEIDHAS
ncbi:hypothetical protein AVEN_123087-1 [Araneus ventricosus]|uniref:Uncharacterized protein n=1 Tax=Araneus ventricosus TaxID=182803 RepID=A0A4Y2RPR3_ARAVE|nr:hypothetical protein AVEN_123087-1 [Araneus ventricosus]